MAGMQLAPTETSGPGSADRSTMATSCRKMSGGSSSLYLALMTLLLHSVAGVDGGICIKTACSKTQYPIVCTTVLTAMPESKTVVDARGLAELAIRATGRAGAAAGSLARSELDLVKDNALWQCLDECAEDIEDAVSHLDDTEGEINDAQFNLVRRFLDAAETDTWSCDESCRNTPPSPVKTSVLAKNTEFEKMMSITNALIKQVPGGAMPPPAPSKPY